MKSVLWCLVVAFQVGLLSSHKELVIPLQPHFDPTKFSGKWYVVGMVKSSQFWSISLVQEIKVEKGENGALSILKKTSPENSCKNIKVMLKASDQPGKFEKVSDKKTVYRVVETDYDNYALVHLHKRYSRVDENVFSQDNNYALFLFGRKPEASDEMKNKFRFMIKAVKLTDYNIVYFPDTGKCP